MESVSIAILVALVAMVTSLMVFPVALRFALSHGIVDNPNARKLQRVPIPVFGGIVVYSGILVGSLVLWLFYHSVLLQWGMVAMSVMMIIGIWDDRKDISALLRLAIEIFLVGAFMALTGVYIDDFHGLWGIHELEPIVGIPMSLFFGVGLINAINLIDGVDGYSSGYGMLACACFAIAFKQVWDPKMVCMALIVIGALLPFFLHNVFGQKSKMFIGDGGTLMLGMLMVMMSFYSMSGQGSMDKLEENGLCIPAFLVSVACIPLFDTFRVMTMRMLRGHSPFKPDKTHLHHLFIDMGFSHLGAALFILLINSLVVMVWFLTWRLGASMDVQMYVVLAMGMIVTFGFYKFMKLQQNGGPLDEEGYPQGTKIWYLACKLGEKTHREDKRSWRMMSNLMDGPLLGFGFNLRKRRKEEVVSG